MSFLFPSWAPWLPLHSPGLSAVLPKILGKPKCQNSSGESDVNSTPSKASVAINPVYIRSRNREMAAYVMPTASLMLQVSLRFESLRRYAFVCRGLIQVKLLTYLLLTEFEGCSVSTDHVIFPLQFMVRVQSGTRVTNWSGKNKELQLSIRTEKIRSVICLLYVFEIELSRKAHHEVKWSVL